MSDFLIGFTLGSATSLLIGLGSRLASCWRGGNIGATPLIFNEGRTILGNGNGGRIEELQEEIRSLRISYLDLANAVADLMPDRAKFFADLNSDSND